MVVKQIFDKDPFGLKKSPEDKRRDNTEKILQAATAIFMERGYEKTTMRLIAAKAELLMGSVYNIFKSKDEIFGEIIIRAYDAVIEEYRKLIKDDDDLLLALAFPLSVMLKLACNDERTCEMVQIIGTTKDIYDRVIGRTLEWLSVYFSKYGMKFDEDTIRFNIMVLIGSLSMMINRIRDLQIKDYTLELTTILELFCAVFRIPAMNIEKVSKDMIAMLTQYDIIVETCGIKLEGAGTDE